MFKLHQVRLGLATNSSSTHSLILIPGGTTDHDADGSFGWSFFTAASRESKTKYAAGHLRAAMEQVASPEVALVVAEAWSGTRLRDFQDYVDHQSLWTLPLDWEGKSVDKEFFDDLHAFLMRDDVVVLGGNDNTQESHPSHNGSAFQIALELEGKSRDLVCRKDEGQNYWTIFNRVSGTKVRMSFGNDGKTIEPTKATAPELVDVKITDWCPYNCNFCYQDSTVKGEHADKEFLRSLATTLGNLRVFEVALGGGEPTLHPDFLEILQKFREQGVVPNFTTKNLSWLHDHAVRPRVLELAGAFAYSVEKAEDIEKLTAFRDVYSIPDRQLNCQYVMGTTNLYEFERLLDVAAERRMRITLLGYKTDGRGDKFEPQDYSKWTAVLKKATDKHRWIRVGIDTALARDYQAQLADLGVPKWCYEVEEGKFSMYIDAVAKKTAKASYGPSLTRRPLSRKDHGGWNLRGDILEHFATY